MAEAEDVAEDLTGDVGGCEAQGGNENGAVVDGPEAVARGRGGSRDLVEDGVGIAHAVAPVAPASHLVRART